MEPGSIWGSPDLVDTDALNKLLAKLKRLQSRLAEKGGSGTAWSAKTEDGSTHRYVINGIKSFDQVADDVESMFIWVWSCKDHLKQRARSAGKSGNWVEAEATADTCLSVCADIANRAKHGELRQSRSGKHPRLGNLRCRVPQESVNEISFLAFEVGLDVSKPNLVEFEMPVLDSDDRVIGDAFKFLERSVVRWEELLAEIESAA